MQAIKADSALALALIGAGVYQCAQLWQGTAPKLAELRSAHPEDVTIAQQFLDAKVVVGIVVVAVAGSFILLTGDVRLAIIIVVTYAALVWYYGSVRADNSGTTNEM